MTPTTATRAEAASERATLMTLARYEAIRLMRHPLFIVAVLLWVSVLATYHSDQAYGNAGYDLTGDRPNTSLDTPVAPAFLIGLLGLIAMNRITSSAGRTGEAIESVPVEESRRTLALCLACLVPFAVGLAGSAYVLIVWMTDPPIYAMGWAEYSDAELAAILGAGAVACLGGPLLGVLVARWWRWPTAGAVTSVLLTMWSALSMLPGRSFPPALVHLAAPFALSISYTGSDHWHEGGDLFLRLGYLVGLCALTALVACGHGTEGQSRRRLLRWLIVTGAVTVALLLLSVVIGPDGYHVEDPSWPLR
jgi:hypothetical protein